jgi:hypothetical protein
VAETRNEPAGKGVPAPASQGGRVDHPGGPARAAGKGRGLAFQLAAVALTVVSALAGTGLARWLRQTEEARRGGGPAAKAGPQMPAGLFRDWKKPDVVLVLSGQQLGYLLPCGCSKPQVGGLERRYNFLKLLESRGWPVVALDLGDIPQSSGPVALPNQQGMIKYLYSMKALKAMDYAGVALGATEAGLTYDKLLPEWALQSPEDVPVLASNLIKAEENFPGATHLFKVKQPKGSPIKVGMTAVTGPEVRERIKALSGASSTMSFSNTPAALNLALAKMAPAKPDVRVLLYQGPASRRGDKELTEAMACARAYPQFPIVLCLSGEDEAPATPHDVTNPETKQRSLVISVGRKGKHLGVVGVWRTGKAGQPFEYRYQMVDMSEDFLTAPGKEKDHPILKLMEEYTAELKAKDYLNHYSQRKHLLQVMDEVKGLKKPGTPTYVGSAACKGCHKKAYKVWEKSAHAHAYKTLVDARRPSNRQYDPECIVCHTVGFGYQGGYKDEKKTPLLKDVGCESCHGPGSLHVANPQNDEWQGRVNPWREPDKETPQQRKKRVNRMDIFCQTCHDIDNDVHWRADKDGKSAFERKWKLIAH